MSDDDPVAMVDAFSDNEWLSKPLPPPPYDVVIVSLPNTDAQILVKRWPHTGDYEVDYRARVGDIWTPAYCFKDDGMTVKIEHGA